MADDLTLLELRKMKLFAEKSYVTDEGNSVYIIRVPGGWMMRHYKAASYTFVPEPMRLVEM